MDPQQLLRFAMRMATDKDAGDEIAGEMADEVLNQSDNEEDGEEAEANLLSWVAQQRNAGETAMADGDSSAVLSTPEWQESGRRSKRLPTPPSSEANHVSHVQDKTSMDVEPKAESSATSTTKNPLGDGAMSRKRKVDKVADVEDSLKATKRTTKSYDTPTASSQARATAPRLTRSGRVKR